MAVIDQPKHTYSDTDPHKRIIGDVINLIDPVDTPVIARLGLSSARQKFRISLDGKKIEWLEDAYGETSDAVATSYTVGTADTTFTVQDGSVFQPGHVIKLEDEYMVVKSVSSDDVTVHSRSYGGTNDSHASSKTITIVGMARLEGDDANYVALTDISNPYNYTSIFQKAINVTGSQQAMDQWGISDELMYQENKAVPELMRNLELQFFHGTRAVGTSSTPRSMGGVETYVTDNTVYTSGNIIKSKLDDLAQAIYEDGGNPDMLVMAPAGANNLRDLIDSSSFVRVDQENTEFGMRPITRVSTQFYQGIQLVVSRWCPTDRAYLLDSSKIGFYDFRPFASYDVARTGDNWKREVIGEFSLAVANDKAHGVIQSGGTL
jgi:hypothetical protein